MTKTTAGKSTDTKKSVHFKKVPDDEVSEFEKVKSFLEKDILLTYKKYMESSVNYTMNKDNNFDEMVIKNEKLRKDFERKNRALRIITSTHITFRQKRSIEGHFYQYYRDQVYYKSIENDDTKKIEL